ncbi:MAG TPA: efflux RND transporter periplasmic adaptor subunit [Chryseosolibacter sp.]
MALIVLMYIERKLFVRCCKCFADRPFATVSPVTRADFVETIPQTGKVIDSSRIVVPIDQLYKLKIKKGMQAMAQINDVDIRLHISATDTAMVNGRFSVIMNLADTVMTLPRNKDIRLRIELSKIPQATLVPVGGFYKDTGGTWIYVKTKEKHFIKRAIKLGVKNPEHFVVLEGLSPGEEVLTSSYENFLDKETLSVWEIERKPLRLM